MSDQKTQTPSLKLNYKRTFLIGFAFFGICLLWQVYDSWCPPFLTDIFARRMFGVSSADLTSQNEILQVQWIVGIVMACDNLAALILLPIFGSLSDKTHTKIGKRMPYILIGTMIAAIAFPFIPLFFHKGSVIGMIIAMLIVLIVMMCYRNPAVSLMPDITPKPLRAKANGIINITGYIGGAFATVLGLVCVLSKYLATPVEARNVWTIELPFICASILMVISAGLLYLTIKENELAEKLRPEMELGEKLAAIENPVDDNKPMSKANKTMLLGILGAEFLWFMADNGIGTYIGNYVIYFLKAPSSSTMILTIIGGLASVAGFAIAGSIADKIGRKWTVSIGLIVSLLGTILMALSAIGFKSDTLKLNEGTVPFTLYIVWVVKGFGMSLVHNCSFPMVVELCSSNKIGKFTGYYYASSMAAQTITPILLGLVFRVLNAWGVLPVYASIMLTLSTLVFVIVVKNIKAQKVENVKGLEALGGDD